MNIRHIHFHANLNSPSGFAASESTVSGELGVVGTMIAWASRIGPTRTEVKSCAVEGKRSGGESEEIGQRCANPKARRRIYGLKIIRV